MLFITNTVRKQMMSVNMIDINTLKNECVETYASYFPKFTHFMYKMYSLISTFITLTSDTFIKNVNFVDPNMITWMTQCLSRKKRLCHETFDFTL